VHLEASTKPHVHKKIEIFWTNIAFTMACPMSKNGPKKGLRPLGVNKKKKSLSIWMKSAMQEILFCMFLGLLVNGATPAELELHVGPRQVLCTKP
jgi:hypothetical protein